MATASWNEGIKEASDLVAQAYKAQRLMDSAHWFLCAADRYLDAGDEDSARWAQGKADQCQRALARQIWA